MHAGQDRRDRRNTTTLLQLVGDRDYFFQTSGTPALVEDPGFAWNHGGVDTRTNGRALVEELGDEVRPATMRGGQAALFSASAAAYKRINAPWGCLA